MSGAQVQPPQGGPNEPGSLRQELKNPDDGDRRFGRSRKAARAAVRNAEALQNQSKDTAKAVIKDRDFFDPPVGDTTSSVGVSPHQRPSGGGASDKVDPSDVVGNAILMTVFAVETFTRRRRKQG